ncbi:MAG TPA: lysyl oxidase family protein, partial [Chitinophagales bacterium]|nr:lysyl oxidase family protein [Chitinophagales bacterium]
SACVAAGHCIKFTIYDAANDGLCCAYGNGSYNVTLNGTVVASGESFANRQTTYFNCAAGSNCSSSITVGIDTFTAPAPETWYTFTPDTTGTYIISTCNLGNTCDTKLYVYNYCSGLVVSENNQATTLYDDDGCGSAFQSRITGVLNAGTTYYIRIGDYNTACTGQTITWQIQSLGPVHGCTDTASCNYNPLATVDDGSCLYAPNPLCAQPDLAIDANELETSMYVDNINAGSNNCYVSEGCLSGYGNRRLIRFSTHIRNIGNQDYFIGLPDTASGQYVFDACHGHYHYVGYAEYLVYDANHQPLQQGFKNGFCVLDLECDGGGMAKFNCSNMGITAGCGDIYNAGLDCQWIDITDIDTGNYTLVVRVNWDQSPDRLGHYEKTYANNWAQVCLHLYYDQGYKVFEILPNCVPYTDCAGDTFGNAVTDCNYQCNGSGVRGDVDINFAADSLDLNLYLEGIKEDTLKYSTCNDLNGDSLITVTDAARLNACLLNTAGNHHHPGNYQNTHKHCEFPNNIYNPFDSVTFSIADTNLEQHYIDLSVHNATCELLAYEFQLHGLVVDSIKNLALGNYNPDIRSAASGHIVGMATDENSLFKQLVPLNFMRVYFSSLTDTFICIDKVMAVVNGNYEEVLGKHGGCVHIAQQVEDTTIIISAPAISADRLSILPNPSTGVFQIYLQGKSLQGAALKVTDALGKTVYQNINTGLSNSTTIDLSEQQTGVYLLHLDLNGARVNKRLLVVR